MPSLNRSEYLKAVEKDNLAKKNITLLGLLGDNGAIRKANTSDEIDQAFIDRIENLTKWNIAQPALNEKIDSEEVCVLSLDLTECTATFDITPISTSGSNYTFHKGAVVTITFIPSESAEFNSGTLDGEAVVLDDNKLVVTMDDDHRVSVVFEATTVPAYVEWYRSYGDIPEDESEWMSIDENAITVEPSQFNVGDEINVSYNVSGEFPDQQINWKVPYCIGCEFVDPGDDSWKQIGTFNGSFIIQNAEAKVCLGFDTEM